MPLPDPYPTLSTGSNFALGGAANLPQENLQSQLEALGVLDIHGLKDLLARYEKGGVTPVGIGSVLPTASRTTGGGVRGVGSLVRGGPAPAPTTGSISPSPSDPTNIMGLAVLGKLADKVGGLGIGDALSEYVDSATDWVETQFSGATDWIDKQVTDLIAGNPDQFSDMSISDLSDWVFGENFSGPDLDDLTEVFGPAETGIDIDAMEFDFPNFEEFDDLFEVFDATPGPDASIGEVADFDWTEWEGIGGDAPDLAFDLGGIGNAAANLAGGALGSWLAKAGGAGSNSQFVSTAGGAIGGYIGQAVLPIPGVGAFFGSLLGTALSSVFGPGKSVGPNGAQKFQLDDFGLVGGDTMVDNNLPEKVFTPVTESAREMTRRIMSMMGRGAKFDLPDDFQGKDIMQINYFPNSEQTESMTNPAGFGDTGGPGGWAVLVSDDLKRTGNFKQLKWYGYDEGGAQSAVTKGVQDLFAKFGDRLTGVSDEVKQGVTDIAKYSIQPQDFITNLSAFTQKPSEFDFDALKQSYEERPRPWYELTNKLAPVSQEIQKVGAWLWQEDGLDPMDAEAEGWQRGYNPYEDDRWKDPDFHKRVAEFIDNHTIEEIHRLGVPDEDEET